jgi:hypothetical protein
MTKSYSWLLIGPEQGRSASSDAHPPAPVPGEGEIRLFVRGDESVRVMAHNRTLSLQVFGPGRVQKVHEFSSTVALGDFLQSFEQQMLGNGWMLLDVGDRRKVNPGRMLGESRT